MNTLLERLTEIENLDENWNGYDSDIIPSEVITRAKEFISYLVDLSEFIYIYPTARQSIQIEFEKDDINFYCEAEIRVDNIELFYSEEYNIDYLQVTEDIMSAANIFRELSQMTTL